MSAYSVTRKADETLSSVQAAKANNSSFAFTFFVSATGISSLTASTLPGCPLIYLQPNRKPVQPHQKHTSRFDLNPCTLDRCWYVYGGAGGSRTRVLNSFLLASYNHIKTLQLAMEPLLIQRGGVLTQECFDMIYLLITFII